MSHVRRQIREAVVTRLKDITAVANRVYPYRTIPHTMLPDITVKTNKDEVDHEQAVKGDAEFHILTLDVEVRTRVTDDLDDAIDALCVEVEKKMMTDPTFGGKVKLLQLDGTTIEVSGDAEKSVGLATVTWLAWYRINRTNPEIVTQ